MGASDKAYSLEDPVEMQIVTPQFSLPDSSNYFVGDLATLEHGFVPANDVSLPAGSKVLVKGFTRLPSMNLVSIELAGSGGPEGQFTVPLHLLKKHENIKLY